MNHVPQNFAARYPFRLSIYEVTAPQEQDIPQNRWFCIFHPSSHFCTFWLDLHHYWAVKHIFSLQTMHHSLFLQFIYIDYSYTKLQHFNSKIVLKNYGFAFFTSYFCTFWTIFYDYWDVLCTSPLVQIEQNFNQIFNDCLKHKSLPKIFIDLLNDKS